MTIKQFLEKAIDGGWQPHPIIQDFTFDEEDGDTAFFVKYRGTEEVSHYSVNLYEIFLDPKAWQAVGKVEGWKKTRKEWSYREGNGTTIYLLNRAENEMHNMLDALCAGKTIEEFLTTL